MIYVEEDVTQVEIYVIEGNVKRLPSSIERAVESGSRGVFRVNFIRRKD